MELAEIDRSVVVVIDLQGKLVEQVHRPELVQAATCRLMKIADLFGVPVALTEQYPRGLGATRPEILEVFDALGVARRRFERSPSAASPNPASPSCSPSCGPVSRPDGCSSWSPGSKRTSASCRRSLPVGRPATASRSAGRRSAAAGSSIGSGRSSGCDRPGRRSPVSNRSPSSGHATRTTRASRRSPRCSRKDSSAASARLPAGGGRRRRECPLVGGQSSDQRKRRRAISRKSAV